MKMFLISDNVDTYTGMRLAGVEGVVVHEKEELKEMYEVSGYELKKFFNTSGVKYRELGLKDIVKTESDEKLLDILSSDGMLIKRPIAYDGKNVVIGFKVDEWKEKLL